MIRTLVIATRNKHKTGEIQSILGSSIRYLSLADFPSAPSVTEDAPTFAGNATKKAVALAKWLGALPVGGWPAQLDSNNAWVLADDSGLEVDALYGAPGVLSARFAALDGGAVSNSPDSENNAKLLRLLRDVPEQQRTARFRCAIALTPVSAPAAQNASPVCNADENELVTQVVEGACEGRILREPRGGAGFGYDPLFQPIGFELTFAELGEEVKNCISHRAQALSRLRHEVGLSR